MVFYAVQKKTNYGFFLYKEKTQNGFFSSPLTYTHPCDKLANAVGVPHTKQPPPPLVTKTTQSSTGAEQAGTEERSGYIDPLTTRPASSELLEL